MKKSLKGLEKGLERALNFEMKIWYEPWYMFSIAVLVDKAVNVAIELKRE